MVFVVPRYESLITDLKFHQSLIQQVRTQIGPIATPKYIVCVSDLPKTRSGKLMRRLLRQIVDRWMGKSVSLGDTSTLANPNILDSIEERLKTIAKK